MFFGEHIGARQAGEDRDVDDGDGERSVDDTRPQHGKDHDGEQDGGKGEQRIEEAHRRVVEPALQISGSQPYRHADDQSESN